MRCTSAKSLVSRVIDKYGYFVPLFSAALFVFGVVVRVIGAWWYAYDSNPDYGVVVLMVRNMLRGIDFPVFFYGQAYMGSLEPLISVGLALFFGSSPFVICLGTSLIAFGLVLAVYRLALRVAGPLAAGLAAALCLIGPPAYFHYMSSPRGGYALGLLLTILLLHEAVFLCAEKQSSKRESRSFFILGFLGGLGFWNFWLTLPALATVGLMLAGRLKWRIFSWRIWLPGLTGFFAGSLPWWVWNVRNGWSSLHAAPSASGLRVVAASVRDLLTKKLPGLIGAGDFLSSPTARAGVHLLIIFLAILPFVAVCRDRRQTAFTPMQRLALAVLLYTGMFTLALTLSSFGAIRTHRYLLPWVPVFAVWAGCGVAQCFAGAGTTGGKSRKRSIVIGLPGVLAAGLLVAGSFGTLKLHAARLHQKWYDAARLLMEHPGAEEPLFAKFDLFGINWATDEKVCAVSPKIWRYDPYLSRLEDARSPGVLENMGGFDHFLKQTQTTSCYERVGGYRLHYHAVAPEGGVMVLPATNLIAVTDGRGRELTRELTDYNGESFVCLRAHGGEQEGELHIRFKQTVPFRGVRFVLRGKREMFVWSLKGRIRGDEWLSLSDPLVQAGYYWSGPRFFLGGVASRAEHCVDSVLLDEVIICLKTCGVQNGVIIETLQVLTDGKTLPAVDFSVAAAALSKTGVKRAFADRWVANGLEKQLNGEVWTSREPLLTGENPHWSVTVPAADTSAVIVQKHEAARTRAVLESAGVVATEITAGGLMVFRLSDRSDDAIEGRALAFYGGQLFCKTVSEPAYTVESLQASFFDGRLRLCGVSQWMECPGSEINFALEWHVFSEDIPKNVMFFAHALDQKGRVAFMLNEPLVLNMGLGAAEQGWRCTTFHTLGVEPGTLNGTYKIGVGLFKSGLLTKRIPPVTTHAVNACRLVLPRTITVQRH